MILLGRVSRVVLLLVLVFNVDITGLAWFTRAVVGGTQRGAVLWVLVLFVVFCTTVGGGTQCDLDLLNLNSSFRGGTQRDLLNFSPFFFLLIFAPDRAMLCVAHSDQNWDCVAIVKGGKLRDVVSSTRWVRSLNSLRIPANKYKSYEKGPWRKDSFWD